MKLNSTRMPWHIAVVIPACNEERLLSRCLHSVEKARAELPSQVTSDVVLVADRCTDNTLFLARQLLHGRGATVVTEDGVVGRARSIGSELALSRCPGLLTRCWLANTDADCELPASWLLDQLVLAEQGAEAVAGIVSVDSFDEHPVHVADRFRETYLIHPDGTHPHIHGANLGVRADVYRMAGGWRNLASGEDHDLWDRLSATGCNCRSVSALEITTSGRVKGRAPDGFAGALAAHDSLLSDEAAA